MTVHREQSVKREKNQQYATIRCVLLTYVSTCFGYHYAYLQENKDRVTAFGVLLWFCWLWLVAVVGLCLVGCGCEHCEGFCSSFCFLFMGWLRLVFSSVRWLPASLVWWWVGLGFCPSVAYPS